MPAVSSGASTPQPRTLANAASATQTPAAVAPISPVPPAPSLVRRSSFEPMRLGLASLPPPVFSRAPPGQRSVPAMESLHGAAALGGSDDGAGATAAGAPAILASGTTTPAAGLGNGSLNAEPWNLWSDATIPASGAGATSALAVSSESGNDSLSAAAVQAQQAANAVEDSELASALAASVVLVDKADKRSSVASKRSTTSANSANAAAAAWPEEFATAGGDTTGLQPQSFALDPAASPERLKSSAVDQTRVSSLIPRNVSFSTLLDLPQPDAHGSSLNSSPPDARAVGLDRKGSLTRRVTSGSPTTLRAATAAPDQRFPSIHPSAGVANDSLSLPTLAFGSSNGSTYSSPATSFQSSRQASSSPVQNRAPAAHDAHLKGTADLSYNGNASYGDAGYYASDDATSMRTRQSTNDSMASGYSDMSVASMPFGNPYGGAFGARGGLGNGVGGDRTFAAPLGNGVYGTQSAYGAGGPRRDSGYGLSVYNSPSIGLGGDLGDRRSSRSASWQMGNNYGAGLNRAASPYSSYTPPPPPNPYGSGYSPENSFLGLGHAPSSNGSSSSLLRYPSIGAGSGLGYGGLQQYGMGFVGPPSGYMGYGSSAPYSNASYDRPRFEEKSRLVRSPLLEEFRADKLKRWGVRDMHGHIAEFMCDQVGSRYIQESILEHPTPEDCDLIYDEVCPVILQLSTDVFANFCVQRLLDKSSADQVASLVEGLKGNILKLSLQTYGCRVIQKAIEVVSADYQIIILRELEGAVQKCVRDQNANHVIQKVVQSCSPDLLRFVVDAFIGSVYTFATHPYSCRVLQRILENCPERMTRPLLEELKSYAQNLMQDQYGNYVIQFCLEKGMPQDKSEIIVQIYGQVLHFSKHKFASNVIEKCIMNANELELNLIASEVLAPGMDGTTGVQAMLRHEYANYPLQRLIKHTTGPMQAAIVEQVSIQLAMFRQANPPFQAKHLIAVEKLLIDMCPTDFAALLPRRFDDHYVSRHK